MKINQPSPPKSGLMSMSEKTLAQHIQRLASDAFEGRFPGSRGEELTVEYLIQQFKRLGLQPGDPAGSYLQKVPLLGITAAPDLELVFRTGAGKTSLQSGDEFVAWSKEAGQETSIQDSDVLFAGYGVVAPEWDWDDYKDVDVKDKTVIVLVSDPPVPDPDDPSKLDEKIFKGKAMTYYGRWTYKLEMAAQKAPEPASLSMSPGPPVIPGVS